MIEVRTSSLITSRADFAKVTAGQEYEFHIAPRSGIALSAAPARS